MLGHDAMCGFARHDSWEEEREFDVGASRLSAARSNRNPLVGRRSTRSLLPIQNFWGYVVQKYRPRAGAPSKAFQKWVDQLKAGVAETLIPALERCGMMMPDNVYKAAGFDPCQPMLQMPDFNSLIASSQEHQVPIFELTPQQAEEIVDDQLHVVISRGERQSVIFIGIPNKVEE
jgi:hypothetical protein